MKTMILFLFLLMTRVLFSQDHNCIEDLKEHNSFYEHLMNLKLQVAVGKNIEISLRKEYETTCIGLRNLKTDSILIDKSLIGIYTIWAVLWKLSTALVQGGGEVPERSPITKHNVLQLLKLS